MPQNPEPPEIQNEHTAVLTHQRQLDPLIDDFLHTLPPDAATITPDVLVRQAQALDRLFLHFLERPGALGEAESIALALRIQRQCVRTVEIARRNFSTNELKASKK